jgi:hypothetical protein
MIRFKNAVKIVLAALREIFDEASYARFLQRSHLDSSPDAYAAFWRERQSKPPKPRCC